MCRSQTRAACGAAVMLAVAGRMMGAEQSRTNFDGSWIAREAVLSGAPVPQVVGHRLVFEGDRFRITRDGTLVYGGRYRIDPGAQPHASDFVQSESKSLAGTWRGIDAPEGDGLTTCGKTCDMARPRPEDFDACAAARCILIRFTR